MCLFLILVVFSIFVFQYSSAATSGFITPTNTGCVCPGDELTFTCIVIGTGNTQWSGTAFNCPGNGFIFRHERFAEPGGITGECNDGAIVGRSVGIENDCYTSQISFTFTPSFNNRTVSCTHNSNVAVNVIGTSTLNFIEVPIPSPSDVRLMDASEGKLTFIWRSSLGPTCTTITYVVSSDCGTCPANTNTSTVICSVNQLTLLNVSTCTFSVYSVVCGSDGQMSDVIEASLKAPGAPLVNVVPLYSIGGTLLSITSVVHQEVPFIIADGIMGNIISYKSYFSTDGNPLTINTSCIDVLCNYTIDVPSFACNQLNYTSVTTSAVNFLGEGPRSNPTIIGCANNLIDVAFNPASSDISCIFLDKFDTSEKFCSIMYGKCNEPMNLFSTSPNTSSSSIILNLDLSGFSESFCYILTASNSTYKVMVNGTIEVPGGNEESNFTVIVVSVPVIVVLLVLLVLGVLVAALYVCRFKRKDKKRDDIEMNNATEVIVVFGDNDVDHLNLKPVDLNKSWIVQYEVLPSDCSLRELCEKNNLVPENGCVYYEFINDFECITEDKKLIFMDKRNKCFIPDINSEKLHELHLLGEKILHPSLTEYKIYVQSTGSGARHLSANSTILYQQLQPYPLWEVDQEQVKKQQLAHESTLADFCSANELEISKCNIYLELNVGEIEEYFSVIILDKDTGKLLTGPFVYNEVKKKQQSTQLNHGVILDEHREVEQNTSTSGTATTTTTLGEPAAATSSIEHEKQRDNDKEPHSIDITQSSCPRGVDMEQWRFFVLTKYDGRLTLQRDSWIIYQVHSQQTEGPLVPLAFAQFGTEQLSKKCELSSLQSQYNLNADGNNIFVEKDVLSRVKVSDFRDVILMFKEEKLYTGHSSLKEVIEKVQNAPTEQCMWRIFVLYKSEKSFSVPKKSSVLYMVNKKHNGLQYVYTEVLKFMMKSVTEDDLEMRGFCRLHHLSMDEYYFFLELRDYSEKAEHEDIILMDKTTRKFFSGPYARVMFKELTKEDGWMVFALIRKGKTLKLRKDSSVLYQKRKEKAVFDVWRVDEDNVRMSNFIMKKGVTFESGKAFYEFTQREDLLYYKEIIRTGALNKKQLPKEISLEVQSFYKISGTPGKDIDKPFGLPKMFVQCTGSRCLKSGTIVLYKKQK